MILRFSLEQFRVAKTLACSPCMLAGMCQNTVKNSKIKYKYFGIPVYRLSVVVHLRMPWYVFSLVCFNSDAVLGLLECRPIKMYQVSPIKGQKTTLFAFIMSITATLWQQLSIVCGNSNENPFKLSVVMRISTSHYQSLDLDHFRAQQNFVVICKSTPWINPCSLMQDWWKTRVEAKQNCDVYDL